MGENYITVVNPHFQDSTPNNGEVISEGEKEVVFEDREVAEKRAKDLTMLSEHTWKVIQLSDVDDENT